MLLHLVILSQIINLLGFAWTLIVFAVFRMSIHTGSLMLQMKKSTMTTSTYVCYIQFFVQYLMSQTFTDTYFAIFPWKCLFQKTTYYFKFELGSLSSCGKNNRVFFSYNHHSYQPQLYVEPKSCYIFSKLTYSFSKGQNIQVNVTLIYTHLEITFFIGTSFPVTTKSVADNKGQKWQKLPIYSSSDVSSLT